MCVRGTEWAELACKSKNGLQHAIVLIILFIAYIYCVCVIWLHIISHFLKDSVWEYWNEGMNRDNVRVCV